VRGFGGEGKPPSPQNKPHLRTRNKIRAPFFLNEKIRAPPFLKLNTLTIPVPTVWSHRRFRSQSFETTMLAVSELLIYQHQCPPSCPKMGSQLKKLRNRINPFLLLLLPDGILTDILHELARPRNTGHQLNWERA